MRQDYGPLCRVASGCATAVYRYATAAAIFRVVELQRPTLLIDEADTFLPENEELRGIHSSGHRQGGSVIRTVGEEFEPRSFSTYPLRHRAHRQIASDFG